MSLIDILNINGEKVSELNLNDDIFNIKVKSSILHEVVKMQLAKRRAGSASVKRRSDVAGSTRKLFRQKGTGNARRGDIKSPLLKGGGVVFGPSPKTYSYNLPKKVKKLGLKMALSAKFQEDKLAVLDSFVLDEIKTKNFVEAIDKLNKKNVLIVISEKNENLELSSNNVPYVKVLKCEGLNVYDILKYDSLILIKEAVEPIERRLLG
jgi:large subunit ribosomal protein L4